MVSCVGAPSIKIGVDSPVLARSLASTAEINGLYYRTLTNVVKSARHWPNFVPPQIETYNPSAKPQIEACERGLLKVNLSMDGHGKISM